MLRRLRQAKEKIARPLAPIRSVPNLSFARGKNEERKKKRKGKVHRALKKPSFPRIYSLTFSAPEKKNPRRPLDPGPDGLRLKMSEREEQEKKSGANKSDG